MQVRVVNQNDYPFEQKFKEQVIRIPAKGHGRNWIEMEEDEANDFVGRFYPPKLDYEGKPLPESYKRLDIVRDPGLEEDEPEVFLCQACGHKAKSAIELDAHIEAQHVDIMADKDEQEKRVKRRGRPPKGGAADGEGA